MAPGNSSLDHDFIPFEVEDEPEPSASIAAPVTEGLPATRGRKRSADEMQRDSSYTKKQQTAAESRHTPWAGAVDWDRYSNVAQMLNDEVKAFVDYVSPTPQEHETRLLMVQWIRNVITAEYPDAEVLPFGSFETKLYLPLGDIDLVIKSDNIMNQRDRDRSSVLYKLASLLRRANITDNVEVIAKAKVPIIKFITSHGRIPIDISINQINGLTAGRIVHQYMNEIPALRPLILVVKSFLSQRSMNEVFSGGLGSYSVVCMVTSFLQMHPKVRRSNINAYDNLGVLLVEFFETYGRFFQYDTVGISLRSGGHYFNKYNRGWANRGSPGLLSIEDPQDPTNDVSSGSFAIQRVRQTLLGAYEILSATLCLRGTELLSKHSRSYFSISEGDHAYSAKRTVDQMSLLGSIMGVTQETINRRRILADLYSSGTLHKLVGVAPPPPPMSRTSSSSKHAANASENSHSRHRRSRSPPRHDGRSHEHHRSGRKSSSHRRDRSSSPPPSRSTKRRRYDPYGDEGDDDAWTEAYRGAQETLAIHTHVSTPSSSDDEGGNNLTRQFIAASDEDEDEYGRGSGRYAILASHAKKRRKGNNGSSLLVDQARPKPSSHANSNSGKDVSVALSQPPHADDTDDSSNSSDGEHTVKRNPNSFAISGPNGAIVNNGIAALDDEDAALLSTRSSHSNSAKKAHAEARRAYWQAKSGLGAGGTEADKGTSKTNGNGSDPDGMRGDGRAAAEDRQESRSDYNGARE